MPAAGPALFCSECGRELPGPREACPACPQLDDRRREILRRYASQVTELRAVAAEENSRALREAAVRRGPGLPPQRRSGRPAGPRGPRCGPGTRRPGRSAWTAPRRGRTPAHAGALSPRRSAGSVRCLAWDLLGHSGWLPRPGRRADTRGRAGFVMEAQACQRTRRWRQGASAWRSLALVCAHFVRKPGQRAERSGSPVRVDWRNRCSGGGGSGI
jgi:hypothetical protein